MKPVRRVIVAMLVLVGALSGPLACFAHDDPVEQDVAFETPRAKVAGTLTLPAHEREAQPEAQRPKPACVVIVGGTLSQTRDGGLERAATPPRDALRRLARRLAQKGYASLRYDKVGHGKSRAASAWRGTYQDEAAVAAAAIEFVRGRDDAGPVIAVGESAGAYLLCLAARSGVEADGYIFLGGHCGPGEAIYQYNFDRLARLVERDDDWRAWAEKNARFELALGRHYSQMFAAARAGQAEFEIVDGDFKRTVGLARRKEEIDMPPDQMFRHIRKPTLALSGEFDLNVPPDHAARIVQMLRASGNHACTCLVIRGADHSFQLAAADEPTRLRERYSLDSFRREYSPELYQEMVAWLDNTVSRVAQRPKPPRATKTVPLPVRAVEASQRDPRTDSTPARLHLSPGIQIVEDITDKQQTVGVRTLEGEIGPLLLGEDCQAHFIDMPSGMYLEEHPHSTESIIYTVRGNWVLCSKGRRHVMKPGTLFHFAADTPTGYEVPFTGDALILIFKGSRTTEKEIDFIKYLQGMAARLEREQQAGVPYRLKDLPKDHPAIRFAKEVNPKFAE